MRFVSTGGKTWRENKEWKNYNLKICPLEITLT
jgi:hypothetical protein